MLTNTFCHISGIGEETERRLWSAGVTSWDCPIPERVKLPRSVQALWTNCLQDSLHQHASRNLRYFYERLAANQHWRLYRELQYSCAFLDIETTGTVYGEITTIALYDGRAVRHFANGQNLSEFAEIIQAYELLVTYNGKCFDIPFIERHFGIRLLQPHIDLRYVLGSLGLKGGLKSCERQLGLRRDALENINGYVA